MSSDIRTFEDLECWKACRALRQFIAKTNDEGMISEETLREGKGLANEAVKLLNGYMNYLKKAASSPTTQQPNNR